jgi:hypothetical protein
MRMLLLFRRTLPRQNNCLCPTLQFSPFSTTAGENHLDHFKKIAALAHDNNQPISKHWTLLLQFAAEPKEGTLPAESSFFGLRRTILPSWHLSNICPRWK